MNIIKQSRDFKKVEVYLMSASPATIMLKDVDDGTSIAVDGWMLYTDDKETDAGNTEILSIITPDKQVYSCQSATFKKNFFDIHDIMDGESYSIIKRSGQTRAGRSYIECILDVDSVN